MSSIGDQSETLRELIVRLIDSGKAYLRAEVYLVRTTVKVRLVELRVVAALAAAAFVLALAGIIVLVAALGVVLGRWLGPAGGLAASGALSLVIALLLLLLAARNLPGSKKKGL